MFLQSSQSDLWVSDGTAAGTRRIGPGSAEDLGMTLVHGGRLFFVADDSNGYSVLWTSDGTGEGTEPLLNTEGETFSPSEMFVFSDSVWFVAGEKVWQTDGTSAGTVEFDVELKGNQLTPVGDRLFFSRWDPAIGRELWAVDPE
jgi:ELWxxDGT repeat protein